MQVLGGQRKSHEFIVRVTKFIVVKVTNVLSVCRVESVVVSRRNGFVWVSGRECHNNVYENVLCGCRVVNVVP